MGDRRAALRISAFATKACTLGSFSSPDAVGVAEPITAHSNEVASWKDFFLQLAEGTSDNVDFNRISRCALRAASLRTELDILLEASLSAGLTLQKVKPAIASKLFPGLNIEESATNIRASSGQGPSIRVSNSQGAVIEGNVLADEDDCLGPLLAHLPSDGIVCLPSDGKSSIGGNLDDIGRSGIGGNLDDGACDGEDAGSESRQESKGDYTTALGEDLNAPQRMTVVRSFRQALCPIGELKENSRPSILSDGLAVLGMARVYSQKTTEKENTFIEPKESEKPNGRTSGKSNTRDLRASGKKNTRDSTGFCRSGSMGVSVYKHIDGDPNEMYELDKSVGEGTYGHVRKAKHKKTSQVHAIKTIPKEIVPEEDLWNEIHLMSQLDHPHIMRLYYTFEDDVFIHIASELCYGGELFDAIVGAGALHDAAAAFFFRQCISAISYLHQKHICHRDVKPENYLLSKKLKSVEEFEQCKIKLIDFGTAKRFETAEMRTKVCTLHYVAPEVLSRNTDPYTEKVDVWSCGAMLFVMLSGVTPFCCNGDDKLLIKKVKKGKYKFEPLEVWGHVKEAAKELINNMMMLDVRKRLTAFEACHHSWTQHKGDGKKLKMDGMVLHQMREYLGYSRLKKIALHIIARQVSDDLIEELRDLFLNFDKDQSGTLTFDEMQDILNTLKVPGNVQDEIQRLLVEMSKSFGNSHRDTGTVNYTSFIAATMRDRQYLNEAACKAAFLMLDVDGDGRINEDDVHTCLQSDPSLGLAECITEAKTVMQEIDQDGDGSISFDEFVQMMHGQVITRQKIEEFMCDKKIASRRGASRRQGTRNQAEMEECLATAAKDAKSDSSEGEHP